MSQARQVDVEEPLPRARRDLASCLGQPAHPPDQCHHVADGHAGVQRVCGQRTACELLNRSPDLASGGAVDAPLEQEVRVLGVRGGTGPEPAQELLAPSPPGPARASWPRPAPRTETAARVRRSARLYWRTAGTGADADPPRAAISSMLASAPDSPSTSRAALRTRRQLRTASRRPGGDGGPARSLTGLAGHLLPHSPSSLATVSPAALSAVTASPDIARVPTAAAWMAAAAGRRCDGSTVRPARPRPRRRP